MSDPIIEHWMHEPDAPELRAFALKSCRWTTAEMEMDDVDSSWARLAPHASSLDMLVCRSIGPHVDNWHAEWSALWILQAGKGHALHIADRTSRGNVRIRKPARAATTAVPLIVGRVVLFNAHRVHWLPPAEDEGTLVVANFDFDARPTREKVGAKIADAARAFALGQQQAA